MMWGIIAVVAFMGMFILLAVLQDKKETVDRAKYVAKQREEFFKLEAAFKELNSLLACELTQEQRDTLDVIKRDIPEFRGISKNARAYMDKLKPTAKKRPCTLGFAHPIAAGTSSFFPPKV